MDCLITIIDFCDDMGVIFIPHPPIIGDKLWLPKTKKSWRYFSSECDLAKLPEVVEVENRDYAFGGYCINENTADEQVIVSSDCYLNLMCRLPKFISSLPDFTQQ